MSKKVLIFGDLKDIIFVKETQEKALQDKIDKFREPFPFYNPEECRFFCENNNAGCCDCDFENMCEKERRKYSAHIKTLEDERNEINTELIILWHEVHFREQELFNKRIIK